MNLQQPRNLEFLSFLLILNRNANAFMSSPKFLFQKEERLDFWTFLKIYIQTEEILNDYISNKTKFFNQNKIF